MSEIKILFVCLGNICRSPLGEGIFKYQVQQAGLQERVEIDSCGTASWHVGKSPHKGSIQIAKQYGISLAGQRARQIKKSDLDYYDIILAMDSENKSDIEDLGHSSSAELSSTELYCLREFQKQTTSLDVPDPYYTGGFDQVFEIINDSCTQLLEYVKERLK